MDCRQIIALRCKCKINDKIMFSGLWFLPIVTLLNTVVKHAAGMEYEIADNSKSKYCENGLLQTKDVVMLDIKVTLSGENDNATFVMEAVDLNDSFTIPLCNLNLKSDCSMKIVQGCFCFGGKNQIYFISYHSPANVMFRKNRLKVNGELVTGVKFQDIFLAKPVVSFTVSGSHAIMNKNCRVKTYLDTTLRFSLCLTGLDSPSLKLSYNGLNDTQNRNCVSATYNILLNDSRIYISYEDKCKRKVQIWCSVHAESGLDMSTQLPKQVKHEYPWIYITVGGLLLFTICVLFFIYVKLRRSRHERENKSFDALPRASSDVDPRPAVKSSTSSLRRFTEILSKKSVSLHNMLSPPKKVLSRQGSTEV